MFNGILQSKSYFSSPCLFLLVFFFFPFSFPQCKKKSHILIVIHYKPNFNEEV